MNFALLNHLEKLRYFVEIAEQGAFHQASKSLRIAQPALSKSIRILEEACGTPLFIRQKIGSSIDSCKFLKVEVSK